MSIISNEERVYGKRENGKYFLSYDHGKNWDEVDRKTYYVIMTNEWKYQKEAQLEVRCRGENFHRCMEDCSTCPFEPSGAPLSLDEFNDEDYHPAYTQDFTDEATFRMDLMDFLSTRDENSSKLVIGVLNNETYEELGKKIGVAKSTAYERTKKILKDYF